MDTCPVVALGRAEGHVGVCGTPPGFDVAASRGEMSRLPNDVVSGSRVLDGRIGEKVRVGCLVLGSACVSPDLGLGARGREHRGGCR